MRTKIVYIFNNLIFESFAHWKLHKFQWYIDVVTSKFIYFRHFICSIFDLYRTEKVIWSMLSTICRRFCYFFFLPVRVFVIIELPFIRSARKLCKYVIELMRLTALQSMRMRKYTCMYHGFDEIDCIAMRYQSFAVEMIAFIQLKMIWRLDTKSNTFHIKNGKWFLFTFSNIQKDLVSLKKKKETVIRCITLKTIFFSL